MGTRENCLIYENNVYPCKLQFYHLKVGCKGVYITLVCLHDDTELNIKIKLSGKNTYKVLIFFYM